MAPQRRLRVLCLHGYRTNAAVMKIQTKGLCAALGDNAEFIFLNGPIEARGLSDDSIERLHAQDKPFYEWSQAGKVNTDDPEFSPDEKQWTWKWEGVEATFEYIDAILHEIGPVDVVLGFSQGAILLTYLSMLYLSRKEDPRRWWKLCICVGGPAVRIVSARNLFETPEGRQILVPFPSIHLIGKKDIFYKDGVRLAGQYDDFPTSGSRALKKRVFIHGGGHKFPSAEKNPGLYEEVARLMLAHFEEDDGARSRL